MIDLACAFEYRGERCKNPGSTSDGTGGGGPWFCRFHVRGRNGRAALRELELSQIGASAPEPEKFEWLDKNLPRKPGETDHGYGMRCKAAALAGLKTFRMKTFP